jgi:hypothetical protein
MSDGLGTRIETQVPQSRSQLQFTGPSWAEFDILSLLKPLRTLHEQWNSIRLLLVAYALAFASKGQSKFFHYLSV